MAGEGLAQGLVDLRIAGDKLPVDRAQDIARADDVMAGRIGMNDPAGGIDQEYRGAEAVEDIGEGRGFGRRRVDRLVDEQGPARMRRHGRDAAPHFRIGQLGAGQERQEIGAIRARFMQHDIGNVDTALRAQPFLIERAAAIRVVFQQIGNADDFPRGRQRRERIEPGIGFGIEPDVMRIGAAIIMCLSELAPGILRDQSAGLAADEIIDPDHDVVPARGFERRVVDILDEIGKPVGSGHGAWSVVSWWARSHRRCDQHPPIGGCRSHAPVGGSWGNG